MADNVTLPGTGEVVASDDISGVQYQRVKLVDGTLDSTAAIAGDATNGLDVDVTRVIPGTGATNLGKTEDAAHGDGDTGVMVLAIRDDTGTTHTVSAVGDYSPLSTDAQGALWAAAIPAPRSGVTTTRHSNITTAVSNTQLGPTIDANTRLCVTRLTVTLDSASTVFPTVLIGFATATTPTGDGVLAYHGGVAAGGGFTIGDGSGVIGMGAANEELRVTTTGNATGNGVSISFTYFTIPA